MSLHSSQSLNWDFGFTHELLQSKLSNKPSEPLFMNFCPGKQAAAEKHAFKSRPWVLKETTALFWPLSLSIFNNAGAWFFSHPYGLE